MNNYYVYIHIDPITKEILYVGMGTKARAYTMTTSKVSDIHYVHRNQNHAAHLEALYNKGYLPHEWVSIWARCMSKKSALSLEKDLIIDLKPKYNRSIGKKQLKFNKKEVLKIKELRERGLFYSEIAKEMGCSQMVAHRIVNDLSPRYKELLNE